MTSRLARTATSALLGATLLGALSACYVGSGDSDCVPSAASGTSSRAVTADGDILSTPDVSFPTPLRPSETEATTLIRGEGKPIAGDQYVAGYLTIANGTTGEVLEQSDYGSDAPASFVIDALPITGLSEGLQCATVGSRIAVVMPGDEAFTDENRPAGLAADDTLVVVVDFKDAYLAHAQGWAQVAQPGLPTVVLDPDGRPGITVPNADAPEDLRVSKLIAGDGEEVEDGDRVLLNYTGVIWDTGSVFDSSWENGRPLTIALEEDGAIPGFLTALEDAKVGDQILAVIPPDQGYGDQPQGAIPADSTLVFVIDVLGIVE
ncbi:MAG TPA: FKBP-type peptidyl-prolyl cis-trans isomerase [Naasia sp.]|jgi:peptidylprolyl isomerase